MNFTYSALNTNINMDKKSKLMDEKSQEIVTLLEGLDLSIADICEILENSQKLIFEKTKVSFEK